MIELFIIVCSGRFFCMYNIIDMLVKEYEDFTRYCKRHYRTFMEAVTFSSINPNSSTNHLKKKFRLEYYQLLSFLIIIT